MENKPIFTLIGLGDEAMRTGRLSISRGHELHGEAETIARAPRLAIVPPSKPEPEPEPEPAAVEEAQAVEPAPPVSADYHLVHDRLTALERLARLLDQGVLSPDEFAAEKAVILALPADELVLREATFPAVRQAPRGPSLASRLFTWKVLPVGVAAGLALSFYAQPQETMRLFDQTLGLFGG